MCGGKAKVDTSYQDFQIEEQQRARAEEEARQARIAGGLADIEEIYAAPSDILDQRRQAMEEFYFPQLDNQFGDARDSLTYALARAGTLNSSMAANRQSDLAQDNALQRGSILSQISSDLANTQGQMNQQRATIEGGLRASGDATAAVNQALQSMATFRQDTPTLSPIGPVFAGAAEGIGAFNQGYQNPRTQRAAAPRMTPFSGSSGRMVGG